MRSRTPTQVTKGALPALTNLEHAQALETATEFAISAYDARFIALARQMHVKLVTEDVKLRAAVPAWTISLSDAAESGPHYLATGVA
jgi:predicted nucleic acid-binding protein